MIRSRRPRVTAPDLAQRGLAKNVLCAVLSGALVIGCAGQAPPPQNAADTKTANANEIASSNAANADPPASESADSNKLTRYTGWIVGAVGAQATIFAVATSFMMLHENSVRSSDCNAQKICTSDGVDANNKLGLMSAFNATSWVVAAAGLGVGAYLVLANPPRNDASTVTPPQSTSPSAEIGVGPTGTGAGLNLRGAF
jgi:hypothetical protein